MKLSGRSANRFCTDPDPALIGALLHGADAGQISARRKDLVQALIGSDADDLRIERVEADFARKDGTILHDLVRARGFFPGRKIVVVEGGTDGMAKNIRAAIQDATIEDAFLIVSAGQLPPRSSLRRVFEDHSALASLQFFPDAPDGSEIERKLRNAGLTCGIEHEATEALAQVASGIDLGSLDQLIRAITIFSIGQQKPVTKGDIDALAPAGLNTEASEMVAAVSGGSADRTGTLLRRLESSGTTAVGALLALQRHFKQLLSVANAPGGIEEGLSNVRPPLRGPRRTAMAAYLQTWNGTKLETAIRLLHEADAKLRSGTGYPDFAIVERCALRLAMMARAQR